MTAAMTIDTSPTRKRGAHASAAARSTSGPFACASGYCGSCATHGKTALRLRIHTDRELAWQDHDMFRRDRERQALPFSKGLRLILQR
jgi:hypothetical protein